MQRRVENYATKHGFAADISTSIDQRGLVIRLLTNNLVFDSGQATLKPTATPLLMRVSRLLVSMHIDNPISVEGNTDNVPISGGEFPSNWELSTARADAVLEFLLHHGISPHAPRRCRIRRPEPRRPQHDRCRPRAQPARRHRRDPLE